MYHKAWYVKTLSIFSILPTLNPNQTVDSDLYVVAVHIFSFVTSPAQSVYHTKETYVRKQDF